MGRVNIPTRSREIVRSRDQGRCVVCRMRGTEWHHRRTRRVTDGHTHCPCNGITLCGRGNADGDHGWVHGHPFEARTSGLIISRHDQRMPYEVPIHLTPRGWFLIGCKGQLVQVEAPGE